MQKLPDPTGAGISAGDRVDVTITGAEVRAVIPASDGIPTWVTLWLPGAPPDSNVTLPMAPCVSVAQAAAGGQREAVPTDLEGLVAYLRPLSMDERYGDRVQVSLAAQLGMHRAIEVHDEATAILDHEDHVRTTRATLITTVADAEGHAAEAADLLAELVGDDLDDFALAGTTEGADTREHLMAACRELRAALRALRALRAACPELAPAPTTPMPRLDPADPASVTDPCGAVDPQGVHEWTPMIADSPAWLFCGEPRSHEVHTAVQDGGA